MRKSVKVRIIIFDILNEIHQKNKNFDDSFLYLSQKLKLNDQDRSMIYNIVLNSIRNSLFIDKILNNLNLEPINNRRFPVVKILNQLKNRDSLFETVIVSANDCLVKLFLKKKN